MYMLIRTSGLLVCLCICVCGLRAISASALLFRHWSSTRNRTTDLVRHFDCSVAGKMHKPPHTKHAASSVVSATKTVSAS